MEHLARAEELLELAASIDNAACDWIGVNRDAAQIVTRRLRAEAASIKSSLGVR